MYLCLVSILLIIVLVYLGYQLLFNLIIPIYKTSRKIKQGFRDMHQRMQDQMKQPDTPQTAAQPDHSDDYIDFEEVK